MNALTTATEDAFFLGEGPVWDTARARLLWVDIRNGAVFEGRLRADDTVETLQTIPFGESVGAVAVSARGDWIVAGRHRVLFRGTDGTVSAGPVILGERSTSRLNDGKSDPAGRYLVGTLSLAGPSRTESLVSIASDGMLTVIDDDLTLSNGLAWSADGRTLYSVDTERQTVFIRSYDPTTGASGAREVFLEVDEGFPDGMTIDADGHLWIAMWGLGEVRRYTPEGRLDRRLHVPAPHTSSVAFAGPDLDVLVITTATQDLSREQLAEYPLSGRIFTTRPGVRGLPLPLWGGLPRPLDQ